MLVIVGEGSGRKVASTHPATGKKAICFQRKLQQKSSKLFCLHWKAEGEFCLSQC